MRERRKPLRMARKGTAQADGMLALATPKSCLSKNFDVEVEISCEPKLDVSYGMQRRNHSF